MGRGEGGGAGRKGEKDIREQKSCSLDLVICKCEGLALNHQKDRVKNRVVARRRMWEESVFLGSKINRGDGNISTKGPLFLG